jgi:hypothetical protein
LLSLYVWVQTKPMRSVRGITYFQHAFHFSNILIISATYFNYLYSLEWSEAGQGMLAILLAILRTWVLKNDKHSLPILDIIPTWSSYLPTLLQIGRHGKRKTLGNVFLPVNFLYAVQRHRSQLCIRIFNINQRRLGTIYRLVADSSGESTNSLISIVSERPFYDSSLLPNNTEHNEETGFELM